MQLHGVMNDPECCIQGSLPEALSQSLENILALWACTAASLGSPSHDIVGTV